MLSVYFLSRAAREANSSSDDTLYVTQLSLALLTIVNLPLVIEYICHQNIIKSLSYLLHLQSEGSYSEGKMLVIFYFTKFLHC